MTVASAGTPVNTHSTTGSVTGTWGTGQSRVAGRVLAAVVTAAASTSITAIATSSTGWAQAATSANTATAQVQASLWVKTATGADTAPTFTSTETGTAGGMDCVLFELSGANTLMFLDSAGFYASGASSGTLTMTATTGAVLAAGGYAISAFAQERAAASLTWTDSGSGGFSTLLNGNGASSVLQTYVGTKSAPAAGSTLNDAGSFSTNTAAFGAGFVAVFSVAPAAVTGNPVPLEAFANNAVATVVTGGTTAPSSGTSETWSSVNVTGAFPAASGSQQFRFIDVSQPSEKMLATATPGGTGSGQSWTVTRGIDGTTPVAHTAGFSIVQSVTAGSLVELRDRVPYYNVVTMFGADPTGVTDSTQAIQNAINAGAAAGKTTGAPSGTVYFPPGTYLVSSTLVLPSTATNYSMVYTGDDEETTIIKQSTAAGVNLNAIVASADWINEVSPAFGSILTIRHLSFFGNTSQAAGLGHGVVLQAFWSNIEYCTFQSTKGDALRFDSVSVRGNVTVASTLIENHVFRCQFRGYLGIGLHSNDPGGLQTDGWIEDCIFTAGGGPTNSLAGIQIDNSAGWDIERNHFYGTPASAIVASRPWQTRIAGNYIENWGATTVVGTYCAIDMQQGFINDAGFGSVVCQNVMYLNNAPGAGGSFLAGIGAQATNGGQAHLSIGNNLMFCGLSSGNGNCFGIILWNQNGASSSNINVSDNNIIGGWAGGFYNIIGNGGTMDLSSFQPGQPTVPPAIAGGSSSYCDSSNLPAVVGPSGLATRLARSLPAATSAVTVTAASITSIGSLTVPANDAIAGAVYRFTAHGTMSTTTGPPTFILDMRWGGTGGTLLTTVQSTATANAPALTASMTAVPVLIEGQVEFLTSTTCVGWLRMTWKNSATAATASTVAMTSITSAVTVTTSSQQVFTADWTWSGTGNTLLIASSNFERVA